MEKLIKNLFKKRYVLLTFISIIVIYSLTSTLYFSLHKNSLEDNQLKDEIETFKNRIEKLEQVLGNIRRDANDLTDLVNKSMRAIDLAAAESKNVLDNDKRIGVLVMSCNRPSVSFHIEQLLKHRKYNENKFPIVVSQDCAHENTRNAILVYKNSLHAFIEQPDQSIPTDTPPIQNHLIGYYKISRHYKWALDEMFLKYEFKSVIITEDDLNIAVDFFQYFEAMNTLLERDKTLFCVSAWNDNGKEVVIKKDSELVHRSDFFPGLGWMLTRDFWLEIRDKWPKAFWDDWLRKPENRKDRACIRPEISRTEVSPKGKIGVSNGQFYDSYLRFIILNPKAVNWQEKEIGYLIKDAYDKQFEETVFSTSSDVADMDFASYLNRNRAENAKQLYSSASKVRIKYSTKQDFMVIARHFGIMDDFKDGVPRTAYKGVVRVYQDSKDIFIVPAKKPWTGYDVSW